MLGDEQQFGGSCDRSLYDPVAVTFADASLVIAARINPADPVWRLMNYDPVNQSLSDITAFTLPTDRDFSYSDRNQRGFQVHGVNFWPNFVSRFSVRGVDLTPFERRQHAAGHRRPFKPFMTPGAGESFYVERTTGTAFLADAESNTVYPRPSMDLLLDGTELTGLAPADGPGQLVGRTQTGSVAPGKFRPDVLSAANIETQTDLFDVRHFVPVCCQRRPNRHRR
ncbi:MAG: hypothetical protein R3E66_10240 [bacterium]